MITLPTPPDIVRSAIELFTGGGGRDVDNGVVISAVTQPLPTTRDLVGEAVPPASRIGNARNALVAKHRPLDLFLHIKGHSTQTFLANGSGLGQGGEQEGQQQDQPVHVVVSSGGLA
ncbi:hypothetical protein D9M69_582500 [compost metagenome]